MIGQHIELLGLINHKMRLDGSRSEKLEHREFAVSQSLTATLEVDYSQNAAYRASFIFRMEGGEARVVLRMSLTDILARVVSVMSQAQLDSILSYIRDLYALVADGIPMEYAAVLLPETPFRCEILDARHL